MSETFAVMASMAEKDRLRIAELELELDTFRDASLLLTGKLEDAQAEVAALLEAISLHKKCILRSIGESITPTQEDLDLWAALQEKGE